MSVSHSALQPVQREDVAKLRHFGVKLGVGAVG